MDLAAVMVEQQAEQHAEQRAVYAEIERIEAFINSRQMQAMRAERKHANAHIRPRNAATLIVVDGRGADARVLMGRRNRAMKFMPGALVFPGGSVDRGDGRTPCTDALDAATRQRIDSHYRGRAGESSAKALAVAAIRELAEESGLLIGTKAVAATREAGPFAAFAKAGLTPSISGLRLFSRAITPSGPPRRFDTWFFVTTADRIAFEPYGGFDPSGELEELAWVRPADAMAGDTREITRVMLAELRRRMLEDPALDPSYPAPYYRNRGTRFIREMM